MVKAAGALLPSVRRLRMLGDSERASDTKSWGEERLVSPIELLLQDVVAWSKSSHVSNRPVREDLVIDSRGKL